MARVLIVDDEVKLTTILKLSLEEEGHGVATANDPYDALKLAGEQHFDIMVSDIRMPKMDGIALMEQVRKRLPDCSCVFMTAYASVETAIGAIQAGAKDYVLKPFKVEELARIVNTLSEHQKLVLENQYLKERLAEDKDARPVIGSSPAMRRALELARKVAASNVTALIRGESGTGKEVLAKYIHAGSPRADGPMVTINCAAIPENLLESEFFGHERGAFTGAVSQKRGKCEIAEGGTLFLDEIGELSPLLQVKLLRLLQERTFERVGGLKTITCDARVLAATNADLETMIREGSFREDLYYRLNVVSITVPPLRERLGDVPDLAKHFLRKFRKGNMEVTPEAMQALRSYSWPGNIRELENVIERATVISDNDRIDVQDLPFMSNPSAGALDLEIPEEGISLENLEYRLVKSAYEKANGVKTHTARLLGLTRRQLDSRLKKFGMS